MKTYAFLAAMALTLMGCATQPSPAVITNVVTQSCSWLGTVTLAIDVALPFMSSSEQDTVRAALALLQSICANPPSDQASVQADVQQAVAVIEQALTNAQVVAPRTSRAHIVRGLLMLHRLRNK